MLRADADNLTIDDAGLAAMASGVGGGPGPSDLPPDGDVVPWTGEGDPPEIIVVAQRLENPPSPNSGEFLFWVNYSQVVDWGMVGIPGVVTPTGKFGTPPEVGIADDVDPADLAEAREQQAVLMNVVMRLTAKIDQYPDTGMIHLPDGGHISALDLKELWSKINFVVSVDRNFGDGRSGEYDPGTMTTTINAASIEGWNKADGPGGNGLAFVVLHDVTHASAPGRIVDAAQWQSFINENPGSTSNWLKTDYSTSYQFDENEEFSNIGSLFICNELNIDISPGFMPTNGCDDNIHGS